ncbi:MAG: FkbM family methyltransferase [Rhodobacterales bacterium]|nr:FkbM family methyltransferase [Rhodobacterales bacterium]
MMELLRMVEKAEPMDFQGRWREIVSDPLNLLIRRVGNAGTIENGLVCLHNGHRVPVAGEYAYYNDFSNILVINRGVHEPLEEFVFQEMLSVLPESPVMLELGSLWAHYSMWMLQARPKGKAFMVEADPVGLEAGRRNFEFNGYSGVFELGFVNNDGVTVDDFMARHGIGHLNVLHADIQGHEVAMLDGAISAFRARKVDYALISTHGEARHRKVSNWFEDKGYRLDVNSGCLFHTTSFDGFILAVRPDLPRFIPKLPILGRRKINQSQPEDLVRYVTRMTRQQKQMREEPTLPATDADAI